MLVIAMNGRKIFYWKNLNWCKAQWINIKTEEKSKSTIESSIEMWWFENLPFPFHHAFTYENGQTVKA